jgi:glucose-1-phosphate cytidylyltransferase
MRYYAHFGHKDFVLCLGYGASQIKEYFLRYDETRSNDFVLSEGGRKVDLKKRDIEDWRITFVDTGVNSNIGQRLMKVREYVQGEEMFLANYSDGLSDLDCAAHVNAFRATGKLACFLSVPLPQSFHIVEADEQNLATKLEAVAESSIRINAGFFVFRQEIFEYMQDGEELVLQPFQRLMAKRQLVAVPYQGFWRPMDTFKDKIQLDDIATKGPAPWEVWLR